MFQMKSKLSCHSGLINSEERTFHPEKYVYIEENTITYMLDNIN